MGDEKQLLINSGKKTDPREMISQCKVICWCGNENATQSGN